MSYFALVNRIADPSRIGRGAVPNFEGTDRIYGPFATAEDALAATAATSQSTAPAWPWLAVYVVEAAERRSAARLKPADPARREEITRQLGISPGDSRTSGRPSNNRVAHVTRSAS